MFNRRLLMLVAVLGLILSGCASQGGLQNVSMKRGFNVMQHASMSWANPQARKSLKQMASTGANAVVLIAFLKQSRPDSVDVLHSDAVSFGELKKAIAYAHDLGLYTVLKPQMLVPGSWAGDINPGNTEAWRQWFESYSRELIAFARFAAEQDVQALVIGTELVHARDQVVWPELIRQVRMVYSGKITYAAHNLEGVKAYPYWHLLDAVSLTYYPSLGNSGRREEMQLHVDQAVADLQQAASVYKKPLWGLEFGMPSASGASARPWEWQHLHHARVDLSVQKDALDIWLHALDKPWIDGIFIWVWYSDYKPGRINDADYTPQNKPAERVIRRFWS
ncbi:MAG: hypothetical protein COX55_04590 [Zetaproteobacteria bacterium CG23_combo_of_CG06-09_8_20_14_all_54_7]|nr:MAG: hypothetical protein COX55_04590 [Zetaproteobacteria bacterium CG23_combo_of_CG06-09_8_20_14_all_54_7]